MHSDKTLLQRLAEAKQSLDLSHEHHLCDVDYLHGAGSAAKAHSTGHALMQLDLTLSKAAVGPALQEAMIVTREVAKRRGWSLTPIKLRRIATQALRYYLNPSCDHCKGRGMLGVDRSDPDGGRPRACPVCGCSGRAPFPPKNSRETREVLYVLERARFDFGARMRRDMRVTPEVE